MLACECLLMLDIKLFYLVKGAVNEIRISSSMSNSTPYAIKCHNWTVELGNWKVFMPFDDRFLEFANEIVDLKQLNQQSKEDVSYRKISPKNIISTNKHKSIIKPVVIY